MAGSSMRASLKTEGSSLPKGESPTCAWEAVMPGDECFRGVDNPGELCRFHHETAVTRGLRVPKAAAAQSREPPPEDAVVGVDLADGPSETVELEVDVAPERAIESVKVKIPNPPKRKEKPKVTGPKTQPKQDLQEKYERQKRALQKLTRATFEWGEEGGLNSAQVTALREALEVLGWLPEGLKV